MKTSELTGPALDRAVAMANGNTGHFLIDGYSPSTNWAQGGPIIERAGISVREVLTGFWCAEVDAGDYEYEGPTPLIAAMRCYVASKLGDEVEVPCEQ